MPAHSSEAFSQWSLDRVALGLDSTTSRDGIGMVAHIFNPIDVEAVNLVTSRPAWTARQTTKPLVYQGGTQEGRSWPEGGEPEKRDHILTSP